MNARALLDHFSALWRGRHGGALLVFAVLFATYGCFLQGHDNPNTKPRLAFTAELVQHGGVTIDGWAGPGADIAQMGDHFYSDKAPGMSLLAAPAAFLFTQFRSIGPTDFQTRPWDIFAYVCTLTSSGLITAFAGALLFQFVRKRTGSVQAALVGVLAFALASPVLGWASTFLSHATTAALLLIGFIALDTAREPTFSPLRAVAGGLALGGAICVEYPAAISVAIIGSVLCLDTWRRETLDKAQRLAAMGALGGVLGLAPMLIYNAAAFGSPFDLGYSHVVGFDGMRDGVFGISAPSLPVLFELIFGTRRGVLWLCPAFAILIAACGFALTKPALRTTAIAAALVTVWCFFYNAGYAYWDGGGSLGPRHITPVFGVLALCFALTWPLLSRWTKQASLAILGLSLFLNLAATAVDLLSSEDFANPMLDLVLPRFFAGEQRGSLIYQVLEGRPLAGPLALIPVLFIWAISFAIFWRRENLSGAWRE